MRIFGKAEKSIPNTQLQTDQQPEPTHPVDVEKHNSPSAPTDNTKTSAFKTLGWLDRFLPAWIFLAMLIGILLGNFVPSVGLALQKGKFVDVSVPIGESLRWACQKQGVHDII